MAMPDQTPVQIAWVTRDLDATETALTTLLGARKWIRMAGVHFGPDTFELALLFQILNKLLQIVERHKRRQ